MTTEHTTVVVQKVYGLNLESQEPTLETYWEQFAEDHPFVRFGWFGKADDPIAILYHKLGIHEMYDNGVMNKESCVISADDMTQFMRAWDEPISKAADSLGFDKFGVQDINWMLVVNEYVSVPA